ncbi:MAG: hypothetical protein AAGH15_23580 [Myxococcota bacterium]
MDHRVARCLLLSHVLSADGIMAAPEKAFLTRAMDALGLTDVERDRVYAMEDVEEAEAVVRGLPEATRRELVDELAAAALVDGQLSPHELTAVKGLTERLGL